MTTVTLNKIFTFCWILVILLALMLWGLIIFWYEIKQIVDKQDKRVTAIYNVLVDSEIEQCEE